MTCAIIPIGLGTWVPTPVGDCCDYSPESSSSSPSFPAGAAASLDDSVSGGCSWFFTQNCTRLFWRQTSLFPHVFQSGFFAINHSLLCLPPIRLCRGKPPNVEKSPFLLLPLSTFRALVVKQILELTSVALVASSSSFFPTKRKVTFWRLLFLLFLFFAADVVSSTLLLLLLLFSHEACVRAERGQFLWERERGKCLGIKICIVKRFQI